MSEQAQWGLIGARNIAPRNIGGEVIRQIAQPAVAERLGLAPKPAFVVNTSGVWEADLETPSPFRSLDDIVEFPEVTFVALPSTNDGAVAMDHISRILQRGKAAVTAEKGAIANNFADLKEASDDFRRLGVDATVGGGTRMVNSLRVYTERDPDNISFIHAALNGTLSFIMSQTGPRGDGAASSLGQAVNQAIRLGYAEPGSAQPEDVIKSEAEGDIPKKTAILFNMLGLGGDELLDWNDLRFELTGKDIERVKREAKIRRFIVSLYAEKFHGIIDPAEEDIISGFNVTRGGFQIVGGFQHIEQGILNDLGRISGPNNGALIGLGPHEDDGIYNTAFGPGAGVGPTVNTMLDNWSAIRESQTA